MSVHATITCSSLGDAMQRWNLFWRLAHAYDFCSISTHGDEARASAQFPRGDDGLDRSTFITWTVLFVVRWASWLIGKPVLLNRLYFPFGEPTALDDYSAMFPCRHYFDQRETAGFFDKRFLDMPVVQTPDTVPDFVKRIPDLLTVERVDQSLTAQIKRMLHATDRSIDAQPLKVIAESLNASPNTIRRRLKMEGSSYAEIKESVRRDLAIYHLKRPETPINEIAAMVGFSGPSGFNRAFKSWTGQTPGEYRSQALEGLGLPARSIDGR